jgi:ribonuclease Z
MKLVFLGTGAALPSKERAPSALALFYNGEILLFDCGEGAQRQLMHSDLSFMKVERIFVSHFHGDHFLGICGLIQSFSLNKRERPLHIFGPVETVKFTQMMMTLGYFGLGFDVVAHELEVGDVEDFGEYSVTAVQANHTTPAALGYLFREKPRPGRFKKKRALELGVPEGKLFSWLQRGEEVTLEDGTVVKPEQVLGPSRPGRSMLYTGDTTPCEGLAEAAKGVDVLVHEATFGSELETQGNEFGHSSASQAATLAKEAKVGKLFLTHISPRYKDNEEKLLVEARAVFPESELAKDFLEYDVKLKK